LFYLPGEIPAHSAGKFGGKDEKSLTCFTTAIKLQ
jgi:hypothetical protein